MRTYHKFLTLAPRHSCLVGSTLRSVSATIHAKDHAVLLTSAIKRLSVPLIATLALLAPGISSAQETVSHDFNDGQLSPFNACSVRNPNYTIAEDGRVTTFWTQSGYDGTRATRGAELCADAVIVRKHGWYGFTVNLGADYQTDKQAGIAQVFQFTSETFWTWAALLDMINGDLTLTHRANPAATTEVVIYPDFPKEKDMDIVIGFTLSEVEEGEMEVWVNGEKRYHAENIRLGNGSWNSNDEQTGEYTFVTFKVGQYNFNAADYADGDTETVYYDNITFYNGDNGYDIVDPAASPVEGGGSDAVHMVKRNANGFAIDGGQGAANFQDVHLSSEDENDADQQWVEIDRGNGYYSYKKDGTNHCIDGNHGGANRQAVYLYTCSDDNQNQQWLKVATADGSYRLQKRNSPAFSIDGNNGGEDGQSLYLWESDSNNQNQQWLID